MRTKLWNFIYVSTTPNPIVLQTKMKKKENYELENVYLCSKA